MIPLCRYILQGGNQCQQAAINGEYYCRHHLVVRRTVAAATTGRPDPYRVEQPLPLVFPEDRAALQINFFLVMQAFNEGRIGPKSANIFSRLLHGCAMNLKQGSLYETNRENAVRRVVVTPEGEEIAPAREVPEDSAVSGEAVRGEAVRGEAVRGEVPASQNRDAGHPQPPSAGSAEDSGCKDPLYIENLRQRREQYQAHALCDLAAGRDPRAWEDFIPGKSQARRATRVARCW